MTIAGIIYVVCSYLIMFVFITIAQIRNQKMLDGECGVIVAFVLLLSPISLVITLAILAILIPLWLSYTIAQFYITHSDQWKQAIKEKYRQKAAELLTANKKKGGSNT